MKKGIVIVIIVSLMLGAIGVSNAATTFDIRKVRQVIMNVYYDGKPVSLEDPANNGNYQFMIYNNRTYVPIRFIAEIMGADSSSMWNSNAPQDIKINTTTPAGFVAQQEFNILSDKYSALQASSSASSSVAAIRIAALEKENAALLAQIEALNIENGRLNMEASSERQKATEAQRQYEVISNTDNVSYPYFRINVPSQFTIDKFSFAQYLDWGIAAERIEILQSTLVTNLLKKYCDGHSISFRQSRDYVVISGADNATSLRGVREIQNVVDQLGFTIAFSTYADGLVYYYPAN